MKRNLWGEIIISLVVIGATFGWGFIIILGVYIYKKDFRFIGALFYTLGLFFVSLFACLPLVDSPNSDFIPIVLLGFLFFWIFTFNKMFSGSGKIENDNTNREKIKIEKIDY